MDKDKIKSILAYQIALSDGNVSTDEKQCFEDFNKSMNIIFSEEEKIKYLSTNIVFPEIFQLFSLLDYEYKIEILHFCFTMAKADRDYSEKEKSLIYSIASEIGFDVLKKDKIENYFDYLDKINSYQSSMIALRAELYQR